jgi:hypothetical protein
MANGRLGFKPRRRPNGASGEIQAQEIEIVSSLIALALFLKVGLSA